MTDFQNGSVIYIYIHIQKDKTGYFSSRNLNLLYFFHIHIHIIQTINSILFVDIYFQLFIFIKGKAEEDTLDCIIDRNKMMHTNGFSFSSFT